MQSVRKRGVLRTVIHEMHGQHGLEMRLQPSKDRTVATPSRQKADMRTSEYLTDDEVQRLGQAARANRHRNRDATVILITDRHGLRALLQLPPIFSG